jgi:hypothetical protein
VENEALRVERIEASMEKQRVHMIQLEEERVAGWLLRTSTRPTLNLLLLYRAHEVTP